MTSDVHDILEQLSQIPIETLGLSERTLRALKWEGIVNVRDCVKFYAEDAHRVSDHSHRVDVLMYSDVAPKMKESGYWLHVMDAEVWAALLWQPEDDPPRIVMWQGREQDLNTIPLEELGLAEDIL